MEQHPVPQNVTTFQFRLIGDMTLKQFGYLCAGAILAYISYKLPLPFFFTWPAAALFALLGIGFAFVPVEERPMDVWVLSFFKSIYSPTQYIWTRQSPSKNVPSAPPAAAPIAPKSSPAPLSAASGLRIHSMTAASDPLGWVKKLLTPKARPTAGPALPAFSLGHIPSVVGKKTDKPLPPAPTPTPEIQAKSIALEQKVGALESELADKKTSDARLLELQKQLSELLTDKRSMEEELIRLRRGAASQPPPTTPTKTAGDTIKIITPETATKSGLPRLTTYPNVVTGIVKDTTGNLLPGVLVTVRDKDDVPLRAFKTNKLGQFAASTQLPPGTYLVEVEDPRGRYMFDRAQIVVDNSLIPVLEIIAKSQKELDRAKLAQQIFGGGNG